MAGGFRKRKELKMIALPQFLYCIESGRVYSEKKGRTIREECGRQNRKKKNR
jgi:hypothetical protein